jgi:hypothetical protein
VVSSRESVDFPLPVSPSTATSVRRPPDARARSISASTPASSTLIKRGDRLRPNDPGVQLRTHLSDIRSVDDGRCVRLLQRRVRRSGGMNYCPYTRCALLAVQRPWFQERPIRSKREHEWSGVHPEIGIAPSWETPLAAHRSSHFRRHPMRRTAPRSESSDYPRLDRSRTAQATARLFARRGDAGCSPKVVDEVTSLDRLFVPKMRRQNQSSPMLPHNIEAPRLTDLGEYPVTVGILVGR